MFAQNSYQGEFSSEPFPFYLLMHDAGQLPGQFPVVGLHLIVIFLLVLLYQTLVHRQRLAAGVGELPAHIKTLIKQRAEFEPQAPVWLLEGLNCEKHEVLIT